MPKYRVTDNNTGKQYIITGDRPPTEEEVAGLLPRASQSEAVKGRSMTGQEQAMAALVQLPTEVKKQVLESRGIDPTDLDRWTMDAAIPNLARGGALMAGGAIGAVSGGGIASALTGAAGAGLAGAAMDQRFLDKAKQLAGTDKDTIGLADMVRLAAPDAGGELMYGAGNFAANAAAELGGRVLPEVAGKATRNIGAGLNAARNKVVQVGGALARTPIGQQVASKVSPVTKPITYGARALYNLPGEFGSFLMENVARYSKRATDFIEGFKGKFSSMDDPEGLYPWNHVMHKHDDEVLTFAARKMGKPVDLLTQKERDTILRRPDAYGEFILNEVEEDVVPMLKQMRAHLGRQVSEAKEAGGLFDPKVKFDFNTPKATPSGGTYDFGMEAQKVMKDFGANLLPVQREYIEGAVKAIQGDEMYLEAFLKSRNAAQFERTLARLAKEAARENADMAKGLGIELTEDTFKRATTKGKVSYSDVNDILNILDANLSSAYKVDTGSINQMKAAEAAVLNLRRATNNMVKLENPGFGQSAEHYSNYLTRLTTLDKYVGDDPVAISNFVTRGLLADPTSAEISFGQKVFDDVFSDTYWGAEAERLRSLAANYIARSGEVQTAGVKMMAIPSAAGMVHPAAGAAARGVTFLHYTPSTARWTRMKGEDIVKGARGFTSWGKNQIDENIPKMIRFGSAMKDRDWSTPAYQAMEDLRGTWGLSLTNEDRLESLKR